MLLAHDRGHEREHAVDPIWVTRREVDDRGRPLPKAGSRLSTVLS